MHGFLCERRASVVLQFTVYQILSNYSIMIVKRYIKDLPLASKPTRRSL